MAQSFSERNKLNEIGLSKPLTFLSVLSSYKNRITKAKGQEDKIEAVANMVLVSSQMIYNYLNNIDKRLETIEKKVSKK